MFTRGYSHISVQDSTLDCSEEELIDEDDKRVCHLDIVGVGWLPWARLGAHEKIGKKLWKMAGWSMLVIVCHVFFGILRPILPFWTNAWLWTWTFRGRPELHHSPDDHLGSLFSHTPMSLEIYVYRYYVFRSNVEHSTRLWPNNLNNHLFFLIFGQTPLLFDCTLVGQFLLFDVLGLLGMLIATSSTQCLQSANLGVFPQDTHVWSCLLVLWC